MTTECFLRSLLNYYRQWRAEMLSLLSTAAIRRW